MHIEVKQSTVDNKWYWHFLSKGRITAQGESHPSKGNAVRAAKAVVRAIVARVIRNLRDEPIDYMVTEKNGVTRITWS